MTPQDWAKIPVLRSKPPTLLRSGGIALFEGLDDEEEEYDPIEEPSDMEENGFDDIEDVE